MPSPVKPLSGRPLFATAVDAELYVPLRDVEERLERAVGRGLNTLILGDRGSGKTTIVQHCSSAAARPSRIRPRSTSTGQSRAGFMDVIELLRDQLGVAAHVGETVMQGLQSRDQADHASRTRFAADPGPTAAAARRRYRRS